MKRTLTKRQVLAEFRGVWIGVVLCNPRYRGDKHAKRHEWQTYVDYLNKAGLVSNRQADTWVNPF